MTPRLSLSRDYGTLVVMMETVETHMFDSGDGLLAYRDVGTGPPAVVLLHAGFVDHTMWDDQVRVLARRHRVIAPDARGHGGSANATRPFRQTDDLAALLRHLDVGPAVLVGVSMGALIAVETALEHPELVRALVISGGGVGEPDFREPWSVGLDAEQTRALSVGDVGAWIEAFVGWATGPSRTLADLDPVVVDRLRQMAIRTIAKHTADEPNHRVVVADAEARVAEIGVPVLAVNGALDSADITVTVDRVLRALPRARLVTVEGAAHYPMMEQPAAFNRVVEEFLGTL